MAPLAALIAEEAGAKLEAPGASLSFDRLFAADLSGRARAFQSLVGGGMEVGRIRSFMVDVAREIAELRATMRRAQRRARVGLLRARAIAAGRKVPPRRARRRFSVARINAVLARATSIRDAARRLGCAHTTISRPTSPTVQEALRRRGLRWTPAKLMPGVDRDIVLARLRGWSARRIGCGLSLEVRDVRKVLREAGMGSPRRGPARPKRCGWTW